MQGKSGIDGLFGLSCCEKSELAEFFGDFSALHIADLRRPTLFPAFQ